MFFGREFADDYYEVGDNYDQMGKIYSEFVMVKDTIVKALSDKNTDINAIMDRLRKGADGNLYFTTSFRSKNVRMPEGKKYHFDQSTESVNNPNEFYTDGEDVDYYNDIEVWGAPSSDAGRAFILFRIGECRGKTLHRFLEDCKKEKGDYTKDDVEVYRKMYPIKLKFVDIEIVDIGHGRYGIYSLTKLPSFASERVWEYAKEHKEY